MKIRMFGVGAVALAVVLTACAAGSGGGGGSPDRLTQEDIRSLDASTLYEVVQRLRPRWLEVRSQRTFQGETQVLVILNRTVLGGVDELRNLGADMASSLQYMTGSRAAGTYALPGNVHVEGVIIVNTGDREPR